jgi:hypothetical protein
MKNVVEELNKRMADTRPIVHFVYYEGDIPFYADGVPQDPDDGWKFMENIRGINGKLPDVDLPDFWEKMESLPKNNSGFCFPYLLFTEDDHMILVSGWDAGFESHVQEGRVLTMGLEAFVFGAVKNSMPEFTGSPLTHIVDATSDGRYGNLASFLKNKNYEVREYHV